MNNGTELDIQNMGQFLIFQKKNLADLLQWIPTYLTPIYKLDMSKKEKDAMYVQDLYAIIDAHQTMDVKPHHNCF